MTAGVDATAETKALRRGRAPATTGCLVIAAIALALVTAAAAWLHYMLSPQDPPPSRLVPAFPAEVVVRCENAVDGWARLERQKTGAEPARRQLVVTSDSMTSGELGEVVASTFRSAGWSAEYSASSSALPTGDLFDGTYYVLIGRSFPVYNEEVPCDPGDVPSGSGIVYVTIGDIPWK